MFKYMQIDTHVHIYIYIHIHTVHAYSTYIRANLLTSTVTLDLANLMCLQDILALDLANLMIFTVSWHLI